MRAAIRRADKLHRPSSVRQVIEVRLQPSGDMSIIDPTEVVRAAIQNAASVAALLITTEAMIAELPKPAAAAACRRAAAWAAWISDPAPTRSHEMRNPGSDAGVFVFDPTQTFNYAPAAYLVPFRVVVGG